MEEKTVSGHVGRQLASIPLHNPVAFLTGVWTLPPPPPGYYIPTGRPTVFWNFKPITCLKYISSIYRKL